MAFTNDQTEPVLPAGSSNKRSSTDFLPRFFRTSTNKKFLSATVDQMISEGQVEKVNAYIGRKNTPAYETSDRYLAEVSNEREAYQLEPALVIKDSLDNVTFFKDYNDYINQLDFFSTGATDQSKINSQEYYAWNPHINWDMFTNYREYYWLPTGPQAIAIVGQSSDIVSTYTVATVDDGDNIAYVFTPNGLTRNPTIKLYRGQTYKFEVNCPGHPIAFKTKRELSDAYVYSEGITTSTTYVESGTIEFTIPVNAPDVIYYVSKNDINTSGFFKLYDIVDSTSIDVEKEIIGKKTYRINADTELSNGMKIYFQGNVTPQKYASGNWYVEGVGSKISLVSESSLEAPAPFTIANEVEFDSSNFDTQGFDVNTNFLATKDYIVINRASKDRNHWSRYNRWFHKSVIEDSAAANNQVAELDQTARARRPIIEFNAGLQLWKFGVEAKANVDLVDTYTTDVFSDIEGSLGYNIDGVDLIEGMRVLFTADTDTTVSGRIFKVSFVTHLGDKHITLIDETDTDPIEGETVLVTKGDNYQGAMFYYTNGLWYEAQSKTAVNQEPLFDLFDTAGVSFGDKNIYTGSNFAGTELFNYAVGTSYDAELGKYIKYQNVGNIGDIVFDFSLHTDTFSYQDIAEVLTRKTDLGYLKINDGLASSAFANGWETAFANSVQPVVRQYDVSEQFNFFEIDVYNRSGDLTDLSVKVFVNSVKQGILDFDVFRQNGVAYVQLFKDAVAGDVVVIETTSAAVKNENGFYKFPSNLEHNPENLSLTTLTLGEITNHVRTITDNLPTYIGKFPGTSNIRDAGNITPYGTRVVQHSSPLSLAMYHVTAKEMNIVKSIQYSQEEYSKFKRNFIRVATSNEYTGITRVQFDQVMDAINKDKTTDVPFYLTDMVPVGPSFIFEQEVIDDSFTDYPLTFDFNLDEASSSGVLVYLNDEQLLHGSDYVFINTSFVRILAPLTTGDKLQIIQYVETHGCCIPATPSKLGLYPLFEPKIFIDNTYQTPTKVIQGHDGSIVVAFDDYRDDLILELEKRIFNNTKVKYDTTVFDINDFISGYFRNGDIDVTELDNTIRQDFLRWSTLVSTDYTKNSYIDSSNSFTFNYNGFSTHDGSVLKGFWRGIFKHFYDTDRPHTHPWEMLGYSVQPSWWVDVYGPAPYTKDNLILWQDLSEGIVREPGKAIVRNTKYARSELLSMIPVDEYGALVDPIRANLVKDFSPLDVNKSYVFGDHSPVETAWRRSSNYPFALIKALMLCRPAKVFAVCFDRIRQVRDNTGQIVYKQTDGNLRFNLKNVVYPSTVKDTTRTFTSGLVNYVVDYAISKSFNFVDEYKTDLETAQIKLASKLAGFTTKEKFKLILDSRSPLNQGNVFIPEENYDIILNTSTPVLSINYSGVIVEKQSGGFVIKGYNLITPEFKYFKHRETASDPVVNVGGISEEFVTWTANKFYTKGQIIKEDGAYYRVVTPHTSTSAFEVKYFSKMPSLPIVGGRNIVIRRNFESEVNVLHYGAELTSVQDVVDFLLGYGKYLESLGFEFENFNTSLQTVTDWQTTVKEFAFWTTQNWAAGSVITLSPAAEELFFKKQYAVVDNVYDSFYEYSIFKQDGAYLDRSFTNKVREDNSFSLRPQNTADGIYHTTLNLVQKEHVLILDDRTVFNDVIFDQTQGYRQDRIKVVGYRMANWNGDFSIPGFIYDRAFVTEWTPWKDYALGETVKYKEFYYSARQNVPGSEEFDDNNWFKLTGRPTAGLLPNWDYRANQFEDFYDLDTDSFDVDQQKFAQHLIGYQKRQYLENIINDDVSQYKFYQGMIQEKGTKNSLSKLFDALNSADKDSLEFYEEWAIRLGQYGATGGFEEIEYILDESKMLINPQPIEFVNSIDTNINDFVYRITKDSVYVKPDDYTHSPFPTSTVEEYVPTAGYVHLEDIDYTLISKADFANLDITKLVEGNYLWVGFDKASWNVYRFTSFANKVKSIADFGGNLRITFLTTRSSDLAIGEYVGINNTNALLEGIHQITGVGVNYIEVTTPSTFTDEIIAALSMDLNLFKFTSQRISNIDDINTLPVSNKLPGELAWVDNEDGNWKVWKFTKAYDTVSLSSSEDLFGKSVTASNNNISLAVGADNKVFYYNRPTSNFPWVFADQLTPLTTETYTDTNGTFGDYLSMNADGSYLFVSASGAGSVMVPGANPSDPEIYVPKYYGYIAQYTRDNNGNYLFTRVIQRPSLVEKEYFGYKTVVNGNTLFIASKGSDIAASKITAYNLTSNSIVATVTFTVGVEITDISVSTGNKLVVGTTDGNVSVYQYASNTLTLVETITGESMPSAYTINSASKFGKSVSISKDGAYIAVGASSYTGPFSEQGLVALYDSTYNVVDVLTSPTPHDSEQFGYRVMFNTTNDKLVIYSYGGHQTIEASFDIYSETYSNYSYIDSQGIARTSKYVNNPNSSINNSNTTLDLGATRIVDKQEFVGNVRVYEKYNTKFLFADELEVTGAIGINYGDPLHVTDRIYIGDHALTQGAVHDFYSATKSWSVFREAESVVDISKIKSTFLYNTKTNTMIKHLDFVDPIRGKILGIAEQELRFKTPFDPAVYTIGTEDVTVDPLMSWKEQNVGRLWWDLSTAKFVSPYQGTALYKSNTWNNIYDNSSIDVYEWVESEYKPSVWDSMADTETGLTMGISGTSKYGDLAYGLRQEFDTVSQSFKNIYYFWVKNKTNVPDVEFRKVSANEVSELISDPKSKGIQFVQFVGPNQFSLVNCKPLISGTDIAINFKYWTIQNIDINIHSHYQLLGDGDPFKKLNKYVEQKWFDSLVGYDASGAEVPDPRLPAKLKYGILNKPRQSMFVNRIEALKQFIERVNSVLINKSIVDDFNLESLFLKDPAPTELTGKFDVAIDLASEIRFVGASSGVAQASVIPVIEGGRIIKVNVTSSGKGYKIAPEVTIVGVGQGAVLRSIINAAGEVTGVEVDNPGRGYADSTVLSIRPFTVLVNSDETANGKWSLYTWDASSNTWFRSKTQVFDVTKHWSYADWYATGYSKYTKINYVVDFAYELELIDDVIGDVIKVNNEKSGGWILLEKINNLDTTSTTVNYRTIGREAGTIQFNSNLYKFKGSSIGYDSITFDSDVYDDEPKEELRVIVEFIKNDLFIDDLALEYNKLFFASLRYVFSEQLFVDWAFKTSFVKGRHNLGTLKKTITYKNDNLTDYESYINEVKPYRTKVREFVSTYDSLDQTRSAITDFDLPAHYDPDTGAITPIRVSVKDSLINYSNADVLKEPYSDWYNNAGYGIESIEIVDAGSGYQAAPGIEIIGFANAPAKARAYVSQGKISKIVVEEPGSGYLTTPTIVINGSVDAGGREAKVAVILGRGNVRTNRVGIKFDRISAEYQITSLAVTQTFAGTGAKTKFALKWPVDIKTDQTSVTVDGEELLLSEFKVYNVLDTTSSYKRYNSFLEFTTAPSSTSSITIAYHKDVSLLDAADRIQHMYNPQVGQLGKDLGQLMSGVDYGGVEVTGIKFEIGAGWDALPWFTGGWDNFDATYTDHMIISDGVTKSFNLPYVPDLNEQINVYHNGIRLDDLYYTEYTSAVEEVNTLTGQLAVLQADLTAAQAQAAIDLAAYNDLVNQLATESETLTDLQEQLAADPFNIALQNAVIAQQAIVDQLYIDLAAATTVKNASAALVISKQNLVNDKQAELTAAQTALSTIISNGHVITNPNAVMDTFVGDGVSSGPIVIPSSYTLVSGDSIIMRKSTSDGSFKPTSQYYDSEIIGGDLEYTTARGITAEEIKIDGDGFVTPMSSHAPEEIVTGQVVDSVTLTVYNKVGDGVPLIVTRYYAGQVGDDTFNIGQQLGSNKAIFVKINGLIKEQGTDYDVNFAENTFTLTTPLVNIAEVVVTSISRNGLNIIDADYFVGDGTTTEFITVARWNSDYSAVVSVNGESTTVTTFIADETYGELVGNIGFRFASAPVDNAIINYSILSSTADSISRVDEETIVHDGTNDTYALTIIPKYKQPYENNIIVQSEGKILRPADTLYYDVIGTLRTYSVSPADYAYNSIDPNGIKVYLNGSLLSIARDYSWVSSSNQLKVKKGVASTGDQIALVILRNADYEITGNTPNLEIKLLGTYSAGDRIVVTTFTNHDILEIERSNNFFTAASEVTPGTVDYYSFNQLTAGRIALRSPTIGAQYVWVTLNKTLLTPEIDYVLEENRKFIRIDPRREFESTDNVEVIVFSSNITINPFAYKIVKDNLNRVYYKRINDAGTTRLAQPLNYYDTQIVVEDATGLPVPLRSQNRPGVVTINGERIEYLDKTDNTLRYLRRGTLGTGVADIYPVGTQVRDSGIEQTIPYKDNVLDTVVVATGSSRTVPVEFIPSVQEGTTGSAWYRDTIPTGYGQCNEIEVFVAGRRLRKHPTVVFDANTGPDSPSGDLQYEAEFSVNGTTGEVRLTEMPAAGVLIRVQKRVGRVWDPESVGLSQATTDQAKFIRAGVVELPN